MSNHAAWEDVVHALLEHPGNRFISIGMKQQMPVKVDLHRVDLSSSAWMNQSNLKFTRQDPDTHYCIHFAGIRLWFHKEHKSYLPFPPDKEHKTDG